MQQSLTFFVKEHQHKIRLNICLREQDSTKGHSGTKSELATNTVGNTAADFYHNDSRGLSNVFE